MCGIAGVWYFDGKQLTDHDVRAMTNAIAHRGPDGDGALLDGSLGLGQRRLAIVDLTPTGEQPMPYADGRYWITFNGEIYNFLELRAELEALGFTFRSSGDCEVLLAAYIAWGPDCLLKFNGMWAFAIWDSRERELFIARDRFGVKPLFYLRDPQRFAFASEMKAFLALPDFCPRLNLPIFKAELLDIHSQEGGENCLLENVFRLRPGHRMFIRGDGSMRVERWWHTLEHLAEPPRRLDEQVEMFRALFDDACRLRLRSDVPIGTCLSGGIDSSAVVCTVAHVARQGVARLSPDWQRAFIACFPDTPVDERRYADMVVQQAGVQPVYEEITARESFDLLPQTTYHLEQLASGSLASLWLIYKRVRQSGVVVTLDGHGGDELLAGYPHYTINALYDAGSWPTAPRRYGELLDIYRGLSRSPSDAGPRIAADTVAWQTNSWLRNTQKTAHRVGLRVGPQTNGHARAGHWLTPDVLNVPTAPPTPADPLPGVSLFHRTLYRDFHETVLPVILRNYDRMAMAHGVEVRMPFMDWRLVTFAFSLPTESLLGSGFTKLILRRAMAGRVPAQILARRDKIGFASPVSRWIQNGGRAWLDGMTSERSFVESPYWDGRVAREAALQLCGDSSWEQISNVWQLIQADSWLRHFTRTQTRNETGFVTA
ncbi:MAG: asparagine synthase (glutamine-hydrolyzing) [Chloroflexota bacterium]